MVEAEVFCKKGVLKNFAKFTGKHLCLRPETLLKRVRCFPVNFAKFLRTPLFFKNTISRRLLLYVNAALSFRCFEKLY